MRFFPLSALLLLAVSLPSAAQLTISEFLAENRSGITDKDGDSSDWIEIHNLSTEPVNLSGWSLTDNSQELTKWTFPEVFIPASGYLVVFASGKDINDPVAELHTNFSLDSGGEYLALVAPDAITVASEFNYPEQFEDISYGASARLESQVVVPEYAPAKWIVPGAQLSGWNTREFEDGAWTSGATGVGYDTSSDYAP